MKRRRVKPRRRCRHCVDAAATIAAGGRGAADGGVSVALLVVPWRWPRHHSRRCRCRLRWSRRRCHHALQGVDRGQARATGGGRGRAVPPPPLPPLAPPVPVLPCRRGQRFRLHRTGGAGVVPLSSMSRCHPPCRAGGGRLTAPSAARGGGVEVALDWLEEEGVSVLVALPATPGVPPLVRPPLPPVGVLREVKRAGGRAADDVGERHVRAAPPLPVLVALPPFAGWRWR